MSISPLATTQVAKKKPTPKYFAFVLELVAVGVAAYFFMWPQYKNVDADRIQIQTDQQSLDGLKVQAASFKKNAAALQAADWQKVSVAVPDKNSITDLYAYIETLVNASDLSMAAIQVTDQSSSGVAPSSTGANAATAKIHLSLTGTVVQLTQFLQSLQNSLRLIDVQDVSIDVTSGAGSFSVDAVTYYQ